MNIKNVYIFNVLTYTNNFDFIVKSKKEVKVIRTSVQTASNFIKSKYPTSKGFFVELLNSWNLEKYQHNQKVWFEYLAK